MRIALVHDYICTVGGAERVFQYICEGFPEADVFTLSLNRATTLPYFATKPGIHTTWMNRLVQSPRAFRVAFPLATYAMQSLDLSAYDLVLSSAATVARYVRAPNGRHVCYCYIPTRAVWHFDEYFGQRSIAGRAFKLLLPWLRRRELPTDGSDGTDKFPKLQLLAFQFLIGIYGGYFGAGMGILMLAAMAIFLPEDLQAANGIKNFLAVVINGIAIVYFLAVGAAVGSEIGGRGRFGGLAPCG